MISPLALEPGVTVHVFTDRLQAWQARMGRMMQWQMQHPRESFEWQKTQANLDAIARATDLVDTDTPCSVTLLV